MKPKALFIGPYPPPMSGPELGMKLFLESSLQEEFDIIFLKTNFRQSNENKGKLGPAMVTAFFSFFARLISLLARHRPAIVYYPITPTAVGWLGRDAWCILLSSLLGAKVVIHLRGSHFRLNVARFHPLVRRLVRVACRRVSVAIVQADCLHDQFDGYVARERVRTLYQAIEAKEFENVDVDGYERGLVLFLGHLTKAKGFCDLLRASISVVERHPEAQFYFAGTMRRGERGVFFDQMTGERLEYEDPFDVRDEALRGPARDHLHFPGVVSGDEKLELLRRADMVVLPSYSEGFSRALMEAVAMGKPIVFTPVGAHKEVFIDGREGLSVKPGDVDGLAAAIRRVLENRELSDRMRAWNVRRTREEFDIEIVAGRLGGIFRECLAGVEEMERFGPLIDTEMR